MTCPNREIPCYGRHRASKHLSLTRDLLVELYGSQLSPRNFPVKPLNKQFPCWESHEKPVSASEREAQESKRAPGAGSGKRERDKEGQSKGDRDGETDRDTENGRPRKTTIDNARLHKTRHDRANFLQNFI